MRKVISKQMSFADGFIDASLYELDEELKKVDELLGEAKLLKPFEEVFDDSLGRPGTAVGIYLRMMYLKFRWGLSYEEVQTEVRERLPWRYFCHLSLMDSVPDATTLIKLNHRFGEERMAELNRQLIKSLVKTRSIKPRRIRIDSTTLEAPIAYPSDIGTGPQQGHGVRQGHGAGPRCQTCVICAEVIKTPYAASSSSTRAGSALSCHGSGQ